MDTINRKPELTKSDIVARLPVACSNELAAVEFLEEQRWGSTPCCVHCGSADVYKMIDAKTGERNGRFLWRCRDCRKQYTVRIGTVYEESRIPLRHWCYAFWAACASKKGVSALQIMRQCQISYKSALFLMHRIRFAMAPMNERHPKLDGIVECDETYIGGKPRYKGTKKKGRGTDKAPVFAMVQRNGRVRAKHVTDVNSLTLRRAMRDNIDASARIMTDENPSYNQVHRDFAQHDQINHRREEYARGDVTTNRAEGFFALIKRGMIGTFHAVSKEHLHRYVSEFEFRFNARTMNDGERTAMAIKAAEGKRLMYRQPEAN